MGASLTTLGKTNIGKALMGLVTNPLIYINMYEPAGGTDGMISCQFLPGITHGVAEILTPYVDTSGGIPSWTGMKPVAELADSTGYPSVLLDVGLTGSGATLTVDALSSATPANFTSFRLAMPQQFGTVLINALLQDRLMAAFFLGTASNQLAGMFPGTVKFYSGAAPSSADLAATGTLLATWTTAGAAFANNAGVVRPNTMPTSVSVIATGTIGYARMESTSGNRIQFSVGVASGDMRISTMDVTSGTPFNVTAFDLSAG